MPRAAARKPVRQSSRQSAWGRPLSDSDRQRVAGLLRIAWGAALMVGGAVAGEFLSLAFAALGWREAAGVTAIASGIVVVVGAAIFFWGAALVKLAGPATKAEGKGAGQ